MTTKNEQSITKRNQKQFQASKVKISERFTTDLIAINDFWIQNEREIASILA